MNEWFSISYENWKSKEGENKQQTSSFLSVENQIKQNYINNQNQPWSKELAVKQVNENKSLREWLESQVQKETRERLDKEAMISEARTMLYEKLWIDNNQNNNNALENFEKWIVDTLILDNYDLAIQVWETNWKVILESLKQLASWEWLKKVAESIWESIWNLLSWNAYERWKSVAELWLITTWVWAWAYVWKKWFKLWMKEIAKIKKPAERFVENPKVKGIIWETRWKVDELIPKKQLDFEKLLVEDIAKLWDKERLEVASSYLKWKNFTPEQERSIIEAHNIWKDRKWSWIYNYNQAEISEKVRILKDAWFSKEERKVLLEKWICGKSVKTDLLDAEFISSRMSLSEFEKLKPSEKLEVLWIPKEFYNLVNNSWFTQEWFDLIERYKKLQYWDQFLRKKKPVNYQWMIDKALEDLAKYGVNRTDAMLLFASTDKYLFENINWALRWTKELTQWQIAFLERFDQALSKMPDLEWKHIIRWDSHYSWITHDKVEIDWRRATNLEIAELIKAGKVEWFKQWDKNILDAYTYVANETNDIFLWTNFPDKDTLIIVRGSNWWIKDISSLSMYKHFWEKLPWSWNTNVEWIIYRWTEVEFINSRVFQNATFNNWTYNREILVVRVKNK